MAIKSYVGIMGSGKTYEVASVVIFDAIKQGRRVISNIAGLNEAEYHRILESEGYDVSKLGKIVSIPHKMVLAEDFWLTDDPLRNIPHIPDFQCIEAGDLVVLDEIWRFWDGFSLKDSNGLKRPDSVMNFFRMHRQMVHPVTGVTCDIALITQDVSDLHRQVKGVVEETYRMTKLTAVGMPNRYRVDVFARTKIVKEPLRSFQRNYEAKYFALYSSHSQKKEGGADAREVNIDKRGNILGGKIFTVILPLLVVVVIFAFYMLWGFFHPKPKTPPVQTTTSSAANSAVPAAYNAPIPQPESEWHVHGFMLVNNVRHVVLENREGVYRYLINPDIAQVGMDLKVNLDGVLVNNWLPRHSENNNNNQVMH